MLELASLGAQVLNNRSVEMAKKYNVELEVLSSLTRKPGTIVREVNEMEKLNVSGIAKDMNVAQFSIIGVPDRPGLAFRIFSKLGANDINVDIILQSIGRNGTKDISFTVASNNRAATSELLGDYIETLGASSIIYDENVAKVSVVGAGMESHPNIAAQVFEALYNANINIRMISTSEIKISVLIDQELADLAVRVLHDKFFSPDFTA
jgi:aspartate kinase